MSGLYFSGRYVSYKDLIHSKPSVSNVYFNSVLEYCRSYLLGKQEFSIKTSGSTGKPKTILLDRHQLKLSAQMTINALALTKAYKGLVCISIEHIGGKMMLVRAMELEMALYIVEPATEPPIQDLPGIDFVALIPLQLRALLASQSGRYFLSRCKVILLGGGSLDALLEAQLDQFSNPIFQTFGMTETVSHFALRRLNGPEKQLHFHILPGISLSQDQRGCLVVCGAITNNEAVVTNDLVELVGAEKFKWLGRLDQVINSGGYKIHPSTLTPKVSKVLKSVGIHADFVILGLSDPKWGLKVTLVLELKDLNNETRELILNGLKGELHPYQLPKSIKNVQYLARTATGKFDINKISRLLVLSQRLNDRQG